MTLKSWSLFHGRLSFALNTKILHPMEVIAAAVDAWKRNPQQAAVNQVEGFVRQVLGWREYMRGVYWALMPELAEMNFFGHDLPLPGFYWTGATRMACLAAAIGQSLTHAYAHHIQRLMLTGSFNSLYWDFYARHRVKLEFNPRIGMKYRTWDRMAAAERRQTLRQAAA